MISDTVGERGRRREEGEIERGGRGKREINKKCCFVFLAPPLPVGVLWCCLITYMLLRFLLLLLLAVLVCRRLVLHWTPDNPKPEYRQAHGRGTQVHPVVLCLPRLLSEPCKVCPFILFSQSPSPSAQCLHFVVCVCGCMSVGVCLWVFVCGCLSVGLSVGLSVPLPSLPSPLSCSCAVMFYAALMTHPMFSLATVCSLGGSQFVLAALDQSGQVTKETAMWHRHE